MTGATEFLITLAHGAAKSGRRAFRAEHRMRML